MKLTSIRKANCYLKFFSFSKIPLLWYCRPKIISLNTECIEIKIPLIRRTKNHLNSMYFGALSIGADITGGFLAMMCIEHSKRKVALIFKSLRADFLKRAEGDVHFICNQGVEITDLVNKTIESGKRENMLIYIDAFVPSISNDIVAKFELILSLKDKTR